MPWPYPMMMPPPPPAPSMPLMPSMPPMAPMSSMGSIMPPSSSTSTDHSPSMRQLSLRQMLKRQVRYNVLTLFLDIIVKLILIIFDCTDILMIEIWNMFILVSIVDLNIIYYYLMICE